MTAMCRSDKAADSGGVAAAAAAPPTAIDVPDWPGGYGAVWPMQITAEVMKSGRCVSPKHVVQIVGGTPFQRRTGWSALDEQDVIDQFGNHGQPYQTFELRGMPFST